jgi:hypothetical protein
MPGRLAGKECENLPGTDRFGDAVGERLALLLRKLAADLLAPRKDFVRGGLEDVVAPLDGRPRP